MQLSYLQSCRRLGRKRGDNFELLNLLIRELEACSEPVTIAEYQQLRANAAELIELRKKSERMRQMLRCRTAQLDEISRRQHEIRLAHLTRHK
jgi:hypothetical protein